MSVTTIPFAQIAEVKMDSEVLARAAEILRKHGHEVAASLCSFYSGEFAEKAIRLKDVELIPMRDSEGALTNQ